MAISGGEYGPGRRYSQDEIVAAIKRAAQELGVDRLSAETFQQLTGIARPTVRRHFGSWDKATDRAGVKPARTSKASYVKVSDQELFKNIHVLRQELGRLPTFLALKGLPLGDRVYRHRFGSWNGAMEAYRRWLEEGGEHPASLSPETTLFTTQISAKSRRARTTVYGEPINFRGLMYAPTNEQGVVFLFGMVAEELGFIVELVRGAFPDCEAKQLIPNTNTYEKIQIEFEFRSSNFREHKHDPAVCDLVVCWEHDWAECPIEALCLKEALQTLSPAPRV
jgi:hypothetical protein